MAYRGWIVAIIPSSIETTLQREGDFELYPDSALRFTTMAYRGWTVAIIPSSFTS
jgi:hypothetical protein